MIKRLFSTLVCGFVLGISTLAAQAVVTFKETEHNFGKFYSNKEQVYVFKFKNTGNKPLVIEQATTSCGCTVPSYTQAPIAPGKSGAQSGVQRSRQKSG